MSDEYEYWRNALAGALGPVVEGEPQQGRYRLKRGDTWSPVAVWVEDGATFVTVDGATVDPRRRGEIWIACAKHPVSEEDYDHRMGTNHWLTDPPADVPPAEPKPDATQPPQLVSIADVSDQTARHELKTLRTAINWYHSEYPLPTVHELPGPGHNSGDPTSFEAMRAQLDGDIAEARAYYARNPIKSKDDADRCENWRKRIYDAAKALDEKRKAEKKPHQDKADAVDAQYFAVIRPAQEYSGRNGPLDKFGQAFIAAEQARLRKEAEEKARIEFEAKRAAREAERAAAEAERERILAERAKAIESDPIAAQTSPDLIDPPELPPLSEVPLAPEPVVAPKVMIGTGPARRGAQSTQHTASITDAKALALHLAEQRHPDLMECLQKIANAAARSRARTTLPGCRMSWESKEKAA